MEDISFFNFGFALLSSIWSLINLHKVYLKKFEQNSKLENRYSKEANRISTQLIHINLTYRFTVIAGSVMSIGFVFLYFIQHNVSVSIHVINATVNSGIYIPILLMIYGKIILWSFKYSTESCEQSILSEHECKIIIMIVAVSINICFMIIDIELGLCILAIVLGKIIWVDFVYDSQYSIKKLKEQLYDCFICIVSDPDITDSTKAFAARYAFGQTIVFAVLELEYRFCSWYMDAPHIVNAYIMFVMYWLTFMVFNSFIGGLQIGFGKDTIEKINDILNRKAKNKRKNCKNKFTFK